MISFEDRGSVVVLVYQAEQSGADWLDNKLNAKGEAMLFRTFKVRKENLVATDPQGVVDDDTRTFEIGTIEEGYRVVKKDVLGLKHDLLLADTLRLRRKIFTAERNISVFNRIDDLIDEQIVVGGPRPGAIPTEEFTRLLHDFPTSTELNKYTRARITRVLREYMGTMSDAEQSLADYMKRRASSDVRSLPDAHGRMLEAHELELEKFTYIQNRLVEMLDNVEPYSEEDWQAAVANLFLLVFPQYVAVLQHVKVKECYSKPSKFTVRDIDLMLVGANGCVDIIEIKKPFTRSLVSKSKYRDNHIPVRELSGSLMQAEKYLFYLSKAGREGEKDITKRHGSNLPAGLEVRIANPKAIILSGRDNALTDEERFDFEFARRAYSNVLDIMSYDDLLRRLDNIIASLKSRTGSRVRSSKLR